MKKGSGALLTKEQRIQLVSLGQDGGFTLTSASRVLDIYRDRLKGMIAREGPEFEAQIKDLFPGAYQDDPESDLRWGIQVIDRNRIGKIKLPKTLHVIAATQRWDRSLNVA